MQRTRGSGGEDEEDDEELAALMRDSAGRMLAEARAQQQRSHHQQQQRGRRWRAFADALVLLGQVFVEIGRRSLAWVERNVPRYIAFVDRFLVNALRVGSRPRKHAGSLRLLLALGVACSLAYMLVAARWVSFPTDRGLALPAEELTEELIRANIIVEKSDDGAITRRQQLLREGGDGLRRDDTAVKCENTMQGAHVVTDSNGYVCTRAQMNSARPGCCNETDASLPRIKQFTCDACDTNPPHCCDVYEHCVSCCMHPLNTNTRREFLTHAETSHPVYGDPGALTVFQYCQFRCRSSSASVQHQNSYRSRRMYCYGVHRPLKVLPTVNSDGLHEEWSEAAAAEGTRDQLVPASQLEFDAFYRND